MELNRDDEESCVEYISAYMNSPTLLELEDDGMTMLLCLQETVDLVIANRDKSTVFSKASTEGEIGTFVRSPLMSSAIANVNETHESLSTGQTHASGDNVTETESHDTDIQKLLIGLEEVQNKLCQHNVTIPGSDNSQPTPGSCCHPSRQHTLNQPPTNISQPPVPHSSHMTAEELPVPTRGSMIALRDLPLLQRKEFKIHGGQITDTTSDISFNSLCKQIQEGCREQHTDDEIIRGVLRIIKSGNFKDMLTNKEDLTVTELKSFLQSHLGEKNSTELLPGIDVC